jgi:DNA-binding transcriptional LysR family regulator
MQTKWLEDLIALSHTGSLTRAAEQRHVTHPAFGRGSGRLKPGQERPSSSGTGVPSD